MLCVWTVYCDCIWGLYRMTTRDKRVRPHHPLGNFTFWSASFSPPWTLRNQAKDGLYGAHAWYPKYSWRCWRVKQWLCSQDQRADEILTGKASCRTGGRPRKLLFSILRKIPFTKPAQSFWKEFTSKYSWLLLYGEKCIQGRINAYKQILVTRTFQSFWAVCLCLHWLNI